MMTNKKSKKIVGFMGTIFSRRNLTEKTRFVVIYQDGLSRKNTENLVMLYYYQF